MADREQRYPRPEAGRWDAIRELRNKTAHASILHLVMPLDGLNVLDNLAPVIDALFGVLAATAEVAQRARRRAWGA